ncbi:MAG: tyrosine-type recombinase/integrase [Lachnospiraceae bacterium]|jgi:integrase/recombinase XerC
MAGKTNTYTEQKQIDYAEKLEKILKELPSYVAEYFNSIEFSRQPRTQLAYAWDIRNFFRYLVTEIPTLNGLETKDVTLEQFGAITAPQIETFLRHERVYRNDQAELVSNGDRALKRKLCSIRALFAYLYRMDKIPSNPAVKVQVPKIHDKAIIRMDPNEVAEFLDNVESGDHLTKQQLVFHNKLKERDLALLTLMLGTGIRVSECAGLDVKDVDLDNDRIRIIRKGGAESFVYFGDEVRDALLPYLKKRKTLQAVDSDREALFLSQKGTRLGVRSIEYMVKKYAQTVTTVKHITPHKLRSTYGTNLYQETHDIYLVADVLGHKDVNTTRRHYADQAEENRRNARNKVHLRRENNSSESDS